MNTLETMGLFREIFELRVYAEHGLTLAAGSVVVDAGANIGLFALFVIAQCPDAVVHCFEPAPPVAELLRANTHRHPGILVNQAGLGATSGRAAFTYFPRASLFSGYDAEDAKRRVIASLGEQWRRNTRGRSGVEAFCKTESVDTRVESLSDYIDAHGIERIDLLKIDVEGWECAVVDGVRPEHWPRIARVAMEVHCDEHLRRLSPFLAERGFRVEAVQQEPAIHMVYAIREI
ncbi:MAG: FkbM family methyltransferase [Pseudomonadota bacterium]